MIGNRKRKIPASEHRDTQDELETIPDTDSDKEIPSLHSEEWKNELLNPRDWVVLTRQSAEYNMNEKYWQFRLIVEALKRTESRSHDDQQEIQFQNDPVTATTTWEPPTELPHSTQSTSKNDVFDVTKYSDAAELESLLSVNIDTSVFNSGLIEPTEDSLHRLDEQKRVFDNKQYQRDNHLEACRQLRISNASVPRMQSMNRPAVFKHWQPVAIAAISEIREKPYLRGAVLGDTVGLGKTWEAIGVLLNVSLVQP